MPQADFPAAPVLPVQIGSCWVGTGDLVFVLGPCVLEPGERALRIGAGIAEICARLGVPWIFKASFDKANRSAATSWRGPGLDLGLRELARARSRLGVPVTTDVHAPEQAAVVADVVDLLQVPAFLCRQTDLLVACAATGRPVNVKKGQFLAPGDMRGILGKLAPGRVILTERGTSFGYGDLVVDLRALPTMRALGAPVCFDATHSVQKPGAGATAADGGPTTGGDRRFAAGLARAAAAMGVDMIFAEVHDAPEEALSDGPNQLPLAELERFLDGALAVHRAVTRA
jgi:2-dehydro-3-deoxyphosphooctonate aldolase (KDO 8-P synthase)